MSNPLKTYSPDPEAERRRNDPFEQVKKHFNLDREAWEKLSPSQQCNAVEWAGVYNLRARLGLDRKHWHTTESAMSPEQLRTQITDGAAAIAEFAARLPDDGGTFEQLSVLAETSRDLARFCTQLSNLKKN